MGAMRRHLAAPRPLLLHLLITAILLAPLASANPAPPVSAQAGFSFNELFARWDCGGELCGYNSQLCCGAGSTCYTDAQTQAQCGAAGGATTKAADGSWAYYTSTYVETDLVTKTTVYSSWIAGQSSAATTWASASATPTSDSCDYNKNESPCGNVCCGSDEYCYVAGTCKPAAGGVTSSGATASAPIRGTSSSLVQVTETASPSTTVPFVAPVATGANITLTENQSGGGGGLSGGEIAGIVIGVLAGLFLLGLLIFYCCLRGLWAVFCGGRNRRRSRRTHEIDEYERHSHHHGGRGSRYGGGAAAAGGGRTWYGAPKPARSRYSDDSRHRRGGGGWRKEALGLGAGLAGLWAILGLKRKRDNRRNNDEKYTDYGSYSSDYYTSSSKSIPFPFLLLLLWEFF
ncbi:hypothetical protein D0863_06060 [Hortaea werneckii]|uniref:Chitin-binding type-1 domain-containing protein n=1 Tax=Hortaea werneckii TaxID=91943 RepID=A0A3M7E0C5_HORWE|nr:hypothetical protein D0863_06060 [Hortaea werneckii]